VKKMGKSQFVFSIWQLAFLALLSLASCKKIYYPDDDPRLRLPKKVTNAQDKAMMDLQKSLSSCGATVITVGQDYLISIPSACLFPNQSPQINWGAYPLLNKVVIYLKQFRKIAINVTSYSGKYVSAKREHALTLARSRAVANYLWSQGIDSRFIFMSGVGSDKPIMGYAGPGDRTYNSRVEITFRDAVI